MSTAVAMLVGGLLGFWLGEGFQFVAGAALGWVLLRLYRQERLLSQLRGTPGPAVAEPPPVPTTTSTWPYPRPAKVEAPSAIASEPARAAPPPPPVPELAAAPAPAPKLAPDVSEPGPSVFEPIKRWLFGGNTIVKVGVGILFVGLAFLAKFASERIQVPIEIRLALIGAVALALLGLGWRLRVRRPGYAQVIQGGAVAILYLTLFVAFRFYGVLAVGPVFVLMVLVAALAAALAVLQNARALAAIGALGGFATPLLVSTGSGNHVALFSYYLVLDLGIAAVAWHRTWRALNLIGFLGTFVVATAWGVLKYQPEHYPSSQAFLIAFYLVFVAIMLFPARRQQEEPAKPSRADGWVHGSLLFGLPTITFALQYGLVRDTQFGTAISALLLAAFYVALAVWVRARPAMAVAFEASLAIGTVFLTLVIPFAFDARSTAGAWALEGAGLVRLGFRQARWLPRAFGYALLLLAGGAMLVAMDGFEPPTALLNATFFNAMLAATGSLVAAFVVHRAQRSANESLAEPLLIGWATLWLVFGAIVQIGSFVPNAYQLATALGATSAVVAVYAGLSNRLQWRNVGLPAIGHAPIHLLGVVAVAAVWMSPFANGGWWAWPLWALVHVAVLRLLAPSWSSWSRRGAHTIGALVLAALGALQGRALTAGWGDPASAWPWLGWLVAPAVLLLLLPATARRWPVSAEPGAYQVGAASILAAGLLLWTALVNARSNGSASPLPHIPFVNPLDLGIGVALFAVARWVWGLIETPLRRITIGALALASFVWLNAILLRAFYHFAGVPYQLSDWLGSLAVQTGFTLLWAVIALGVMWLSARRRMRLPWMVGATLLGAVVLKLLLVDQSGRNTVTRIISFIGVGALMLLIGYVAPLPVREKPDAHA